MRARNCNYLWRFSLVVTGLTLAASAVAFAQVGSISSVSSRPFVVGIQPVVGRNGAVGGVLVDPQGMVAAADIEAMEQLSEIRARALQPIPQDMRRSSPMRKVSLKRLQAAIVAQQSRGALLPDDIQFLAGLQQVQWLFVFPDRQDIVLAGPAEGWHVDGQGHVVGVETGQAVLQLSDLIVCLRAADVLWTQEALACSIDPAPEGVRRVQRALSRRNLRPTQAMLEQLQDLLGPQQVTLSGVPATSPLARTLVAADIRMKRLAMGLEPASTAGIPSYFDLLRADKVRHSGSATPRWWLEPDYALARDPDGMTWQIGPGTIRALADEGDGTDQVEATPADRWAEQFTQQYAQLAQRWPVLSELQNSIELALVAAVLTHYELAAIADCDLSVLLGENYVKTAELPTPKQIPPHATAARIHGRWIVSISGGVHVDALAQLQNVRTDAAVERVRHRLAEPAGEAWWWDE